MKPLWSFIFSIAFVNYLSAQVPNQFNYQAVARNSLGQSIGNANIKLRLSILDGSATGTVVYSEVRQTITNQLGLFTAAIGGPGAASTTGSFATIDWSTGKKFIKVEADPLGGNSFSILGNTEMLSVPYALYAVNGKLGPAGPANILSVGSVTTGIPGSAASVTITGTSPAQLLNLTIPTGAAGPTGATGSQGPIGLTGAAGPQGIQGVPGPTGPIGPAGAAGPAGPQGIQGIPGPAGIAGPAGATGPAGPQGIPGKNTLIKTSAEAAGANCIDGGVKQEYGIDANSNGILDAAEIDATLTKYICNGSAANIASAWNINGNTAINPAIQFIGTTDDKPLLFRINNIKAGLLDSATQNTAFGFRSLDSAAATINQFNAAFGYKTLISNSTGTFNTAIGGNALRANKSGMANTAIGYATLFTNTSGDYNTATGQNALHFNSTGYWNTANGVSALIYNNTGNYNTANGVNALSYNISGDGNSAHGVSALAFNSTGTYNTASGYQSLYANYNGSYNTASGTDALYTNNNGIYNTSNGYRSLYYNNGSRNTATGSLSLFSNTTGLSNTSIGTDAMYVNAGGSYNTAIGHRALVDNINGSYNIAIGYNAGTNPGSPNVVNTISIGNDSYLNGASNQAFLGNLSTTWNGGNKTWSTYSDERIKNHITENVKGLDFILQLRPVTYYRSINAALQITGTKTTTDFPGKYDVEKILETGFLAQEVVAAAKKSGYDFSGVTVPKKASELYTLSYEQFVVPLTKAIQEQQAIITSQQKQLDALEKRLAALEAKK